jgi:DNA repair protein RecN (Recombination protein N)
MWQRLAMTSLGVIDSAELELGSGFTVITGETGAGKTMVVTALGLLRGERADPGLVRKGVEQARVEATVRVSGTGSDAAAAAVIASVEEAGGALDDGVLELGRALSAQGRSRAFAGGVTVPAGLLSSLADDLVAVHGQSDQHRLVRPSAQLGALDAFAGERLAALKARYAPAYAEWRATETRIADLTAHAQERARELDLLRLGLEEIGAVEPRAGEDDTLTAEVNRLGHAESLVRAAIIARDMLSGDEPGAARDSVSAAAGALDDVAGHDPVLDAVRMRVHELAILLDDVGGDLSAYATGIDMDPARLAAVQDRLAALTSLRRKYGPTLDDVLAWQDESAARVLAIDVDDESMQALRDEADRLHAVVENLGGKLTEERRRSADDLGSRVGAELAQLSMPSARLTVAVSPRPEWGPDGRDDVEFLFAPNSGLDPRPLSKGASGGELSRVMLGLEVVLADRSTVPTLVFDEVDAGIGGKAAVEVGRRLAKLAENTQVLAVTHLPQVAAFADHHFRVLKDDDGNVTSSSVIELTDGDRVDELARMLAGQEDSATAQAHARELLERASRG